MGIGVSYIGSKITDAVIDRYWDDPIGQASKDIQSIGSAISKVIPPLNIPKIGWW